MAPIALMLAQPPAPAPDAAAAREPTRIAVRVVPTRDAADNQKVLDTLDRYFEGTLRRFDRDQPLNALSLQVCGHRNAAWIARIRERAKALRRRYPRGHAGDAAAVSVLSARRTDHDSEG